MSSQFDTTEHGDARLTIVLTGAHDYFRFAVNMLDDQCEFSAAGREALAKLRDYMGASGFREWASRMLGKPRFDYLAAHGFFDHPAED
jgi:hypothetical protein